MIRAYIELVRGLPAILQLMLLFFGLTQFGIFLSPMVASAIWLCFYGTAYASVIVRTGINGVPKGQLEASMALGLRRYQTLRRDPSFDQLFRASVEEHDTDLFHRRNGHPLPSSIRCKCD